MRLILDAAFLEILAGYSQSRSFDDRSNSQPTTYPTRAETSRGLLINALNWQTFVFYALKSAPRYRVFVKSPILPKYRPRIRLPPWGSLVCG